MALNKALFVAQNLVVDEARMRQNVAASNGLMLAEAATFALARFMPRAEAKALVGEACRAALAEERHLIDVVRERTDAPVEWDALRDEAAYFGSSQPFIDRVLAEVARLQG